VLGVALIQYFEYAWKEASQKRTFWEKVSRRIYTMATKKKAAKKKAAKKKKH
jgi:hypothetical protein